MLSVRSSGLCDLLSCAALGEHCRGMKTRLTLPEEIGAACEPKRVVALDPRAAKPYDGEDRVPNARMLTPAESCNGPRR